MSYNGARTSKKSFILRADGWFHTSDVRAVAVVPGRDDLFLSASRDATASFLQLSSETKDDLAVYRIFLGHMDFVNFIFFHPGLECIGGDSCIVSGSNDQHVAIWDSETAKLRAILDGHTKGVCHGTFIGFTDGDDTYGGDIVTGDWGGVCNVFDHATGRIKYSYTEHTTSIRGIAHLPNTRLVVSASGDRTIHAWDVHTGLTRQVFRGHTDVVQCVCAISASVFASGSNDCTVRLWRLGQDVAFRVLQGHDSIIYSLTYNAVTNEVFSASEDHTVRVWGVADVVVESDSLHRTSRSSECTPVEVIYHPCVVWGIASLPTTGDLATGGSDGCVRVWTRNEALIASPEKIELLNAAISSQTVDIKLTELDNAAAGSNNGLNNVKIVPIDAIYQQRGRYEGEKLFAKNKSGQVEVYMWGNDRWDKVFTVVSGPDQAAYTGEPAKREKKTHQGKSYDYLFDVEVEGRMLKLGYNVGDSIFETSQLFINEHPGIVSQDSREEIQNFLLAHISPEDVSQARGAATSSNASVRGTLPVTKPADSHGDDPFEASYKGSDVSVLPHTSSEVFSKFNAKGAQTKVNEYLKEVSSFSPGSSPESFYHLMDDVQQLHTLSNDGICFFCKKLCDVRLVLPEGSRFPLLDAIRFLFYQLMAHPGSVTSMPTAVSVLLDAFEELLRTSDGILAVEAAMSDAETLVSLRLICNAFAVLTKFSCEISHAHKALLVITTKRLAMLALQKLSNTNIKSTLVSLMINTSLYLPSMAEQCPLKEGNKTTKNDDASSGTAAQMAVVLVSIIAKFLVLEPIGSAHISHVLRVLYTLFDAGKSIPKEHQKHKTECQNVEPIWLNGAREMGKSMLQYTLHSIETGSNAGARPIARKITTILGL